MKALLVASSIAFAASAGTAWGVAITPTVTTSIGTIYNTAALTDFSTTGADMVGSLVTVAFGNGTTGTATWTATGAFGTGWSLTEVGDTFTSPFVLANTGRLTITGMTFNGVPGNTTFDIVGTPADSPGSASGRVITDVNGPAGLSVAALYTNRLQVGGVFYGDEYTTLILTLGGTGLTTGRSLSFITDTDNAMATGPGGGITPVPEPASVALLGGAGLAFLAARRRRARA